MLTSPRDGGFCAVGSPRRPLQSRLDRAHRFRGETLGSYRNSSLEKHIPSFYAPATTAMGLPAALHPSILSSPFLLPRGEAIPSDERGHSLLLKEDSKGVSFSTARLTAFGSFPLPPRQGAPSFPLCLQVESEDSQPSFNTALSTKSDSRWWRLPLLACAFFGGIRSLPTDDPPSERAC